MTSRRALAAIAAIAAIAALPTLAGCGGDDSSTPATTTTSNAETMTHEETAAEDGASTSEEQADTGEDQMATNVETVNVSVVGAQPEGGIVRATLAKNDKVVLVVSSDVADEIHVHGYDLMKDVAAGGTARIMFVADVPGRFEVELEDRGVQIADLTVR
jgi:ABC-type glycerol-3-phosphate transport system substrate-binding protein